MLTTTVTGGDTIATVVNWKEAVYKQLEFALSDVGILPPAGATIKVRELITQKDQPSFTYNATQKFQVPDLPARGAKVYRFTVVDQPPSLI